MEWWEGEEVVAECWEGEEEERELVSVECGGEEEGLVEGWGEVVVEFNLHISAVDGQETIDWSTNVSSLFTDLSRYTNSKGYEQSQGQLPKTF